MRQIEILDSTLRDGAQCEGISYSVADKLNIATALDELGVAFIEGGNPFSNPKDAEFFHQAAKQSWKNARLVAFGATVRSGMTPEEDSGILTLAETPVEIISIFGKASVFHVERILRTTREENLRMIRESIRYLKTAGKRVFFDAEHFFDGFVADQAYAMEVLFAAADAGTERLILCDTNGGTFPDEVGAILSEVVRSFPGMIGVHLHDDNGCGVAGSILAAKQGAVQVQGTLIGVGERCGNANLSAIIPGLELKSGLACLPEGRVERITQAARYVAEISNVSLPAGLPYVGKRAFSHKGGMHVDGVLKERESFEHIPPEAVGNRRSLLISEVSGRAAVHRRVSRIYPEMDKASPELDRIAERLKEMEHRGYSYESADASFEMLVKKGMGDVPSFFELQHFKIIGEQNASSTAVVKVRVGNASEITAAEGDGPVHALDRALRRALEVFYPALRQTRLIDYKVRVMDPGAATAAFVRVLIETTDGTSTWTTVGVSKDIIEASWQALTDSIEYKLMKDGVAGKMDG